MSFSFLSSAGRMGLVLIAAPLLAFAQSSEVVVNFADRPAVFTEQRTNGIRTEIGDAPGARGGRVFKLIWSAHEGKFVAGHLESPGPLLISKPGRYRITARVCVEQLGKEASRLSLRLYDRGRETHQYTGQITPGEPGWVEVSWTVDTENPAENATKPWGGDQNQELDLPVRLRGFALSFAKGKTQGGEFWADEVRVNPLGD